MIFPQIYNFLIKNIFVTVQFLGSTAILLQQMEIEASDQEKFQQIQVIEGAEKGDEVIDDSQEHKTLNHHSLYYSFMERYFTSYQNQNQTLHRHSNGLFMIGVKAQTLPSKPVQIVDVIVVQEVKGKKKRGGSRVTKNSVLVEIICQGGEKVPVLCLVQGVVLQKNQRLTPDILGRPEGYIAVINPGKKFKVGPDFKQILLPHQLRK